MRKALRWKEDFPSGIMCNAFTCLPNEKCANSQDLPSEKGRESRQVQGGCCCSSQAPLWSLLSRGGRLPQRNSLPRFRPGDPFTAGLHLRTRDKAASVNITQARANHLVIIAAWDHINFCLLIQISAPPSYIISYNLQLIQLMMGQSWVLFLFHVLPSAFSVRIINFEEVDVKRSLLSNFIAAVYMFLLPCAWPTSGIASAEKNSFSSYCPK